MGDLYERERVTKILLHEDKSVSPPHFFSSNQHYSRKFWLDSPVLIVVETRTMRKGNVLEVNEFDGR